MLFYLWRSLRSPQGAINWNTNVYMSTASWRAQKKPFERQNSRPTHRLSSMCTPPRLTKSFHCILFFRHSHMSQWSQGRTCHKKNSWGLERHDQWLRVCIALAKDPRLVPSILNEQPTTSCNSSSRGSDSLFWPPKTPTLIHTYTHTGTHGYIYT